MTAHDSWRSVTLGAAIQPVTERVTPDLESNLPFIGMEHVESHSGRVVSSAWAASVSSPCPLVRPGDVLYGRLRPYLNKVAISPKNALVSGEFIVFRENDTLDARFLKWRLTAPDFVAFACSLNAGDRPRVKWPQMSQFRFFVPPKPEQRRVVEILEDHMSRLDAAVDSLTADLGRLDILERSILQKGLRGSLVSDDLSEGPGHALLSSPPLDPSSVTSSERIWDVPSAWAWTRVGDMFSVHVGVTPPRGDESMWGGEIPWVSSGEVSFNRIRTTRETIAEKALGNPSKRLHPPGTVMLAMIGEGKTRGQAAILDIAAAHNQNCASIRVGETKVLPEFVYAFLKERYFETRRGSAGGNQPALNKRSIQRIPLPIPPLATQRRLVATFDSATADLQRLRVSTELVLSRSHGLRRALLASAFSGKLTGRRTDDKRLMELAHG